MNIKRCDSRQHLKKKNANVGSGRAPRSAAKMCARNQLPPRSHVSNHLEEWSRVAFNKRQEKLNHLQLSSPSCSNPNSLSSQAKCGRLCWTVAGSRVTHYVHTRTRCRNRSTRPLPLVKVFFFLQILLLKKRFADC